MMCKYTTRCYIFNQHLRYNNVLTYFFIFLTTIGWNDFGFSYIRRHFDQADKNKDGDLSLDECMKIAKQLNVKLSENEIEKCFKVWSKYIIMKGERKCLLNLLLDYWLSIKFLGGAAYGSTILQQKDKSEKLCRKTWFWWIPNVLFWTVTTKWSRTNNSKLLRWSDLQTFL